MELYIWWLQEIRRFEPSTVSWRFSIAAGFYKTCVIDSLAGLPTAARESRGWCAFAPVAMLGLLELRIFEATGATIADLGEEPGHRVTRCAAKAPRSSLSPAASGRPGYRPVHRYPHQQANLLSSRSVRWTATQPPGGLRRLSKIAVRITRCGRSANSLRWRSRNSAPGPWCR